jgi:RNA polymerase sigma factor (sigma-70 family)
VLHAQRRKVSSPQGQGVPDGVLVQQAQAGDQRAFEVLVNRYHSSLANYLAGFLKDGDQVSDVLQQVDLQLYLSLPTLRATVSLKGWLFRLARSRCLDELRRRRRRAEIPFSSFAWDVNEEEYPFIEAIPDPSPIPEELAEQFELSWPLHAALVSLPPGLRLIIHLRCFRQLTFAEIGSMLNMREARVKSSFYRALSYLRRALTCTLPLASVS